jgi:hypothetical protein
MYGRGNPKYLLLTFGGNLGSLPLDALEALLATLFPPALRQLVFDTDVAAVETLRDDPVLYRVNADVLVAALLLAIELRQFVDAVDADTTETWLAEAGEAPRGYCGRAR